MRQWLKRSIVSELAAKMGQGKLQSHGRLMANFSKRTQPLLKGEGQENPKAS